MPPRRIQNTSPVWRYFSSPEVAMRAVRRQRRALRFRHAPCSLFVRFHHKVPIQAGRRARPGCPCPREQDIKIRMGLKPLMFVTAGLFWAGAVGAGLSATWRYENAPGAQLRSAPVAWPVDSTIPRTPGRASLVMIAHPHCPCSNASIGELALVMAHVQGVVDAYVLFYRPAGVRANWHETGLWSAAARIPGVKVRVDEDGREQRRFGVASSGHTLLYDSGGALQFSGGITPARGHSGDNAGRTAILASLLGGRPDRHSTFVFGCSLVDRCASCRDASADASE